MQDSIRNSFVEINPILITFKFFEVGLEQLFFFFFTPTPKLFEIPTPQTLLLRIFNYNIFTFDNTLFSKSQIDFLKYYM